jgi:glutathione S-transferase
VIIEKGPSQVNDTSFSQRMRLYVARGACCLGAHVTVRELDLPVDVVVVPLRTPESAIHGVNPLGRVPALTLEDGTVLTENSAILPYLADLDPEGGMFAPVGTSERARIQSWVGYINSEVHACTFRAINRPERYLPEPDRYDDIRRRGREQLTIVFSHLERRLTGRDFLEGDRFTIADAYLGVFLRWTAAFDGLAQLPELARVLANYNARPSVVAALAAEAAA